MENIKNFLSKGWLLSLNFVFPLPFYIGEAFHLLGLGFVDSIKAVFFVSIPVSAICMYLFLREFTSKWLSLAGALLYVYTPYRATDLYVRGAIGEIVSFATLPVIALSIIKLTDEKEYSLRWVGFGAVALSSLVLSHNITAFMVIPFIFLLGFLRFFQITRKIKIFGRLILTFFLGLLISSYFWVPAIVDSVLMKEDTVFNFADHFPTFRQLFTPSWGYGASVPGPYDGMSFFLGLINIIVLIVGVLAIFLFWKKYNPNQKIILVWAFFSFIVSIFMMNYRSSFIWHNFPLLPYFQFPWRFLIMTTFIIPVFFVCFKQIKFQNIIACMLVFLAVILNIGNFRPHDFLGRGDNYYINRYIPIPFASSEYLTLAEEYLRLPKVAESRPDRNYPLISLNNGTAEILRNDNNLNIYIETSSSEDMILNYNKYFFPGWKAALDSSETEIFAGAPFGQINVKIPPGNHKLEIKFGETPLKVMLDIFGVTALLVAVFLIVKYGALKKT